MASSRAQEVAEILWELKRADKLATFTSIARRAGFSPGSNGRTMATCLKTVRKDWPHLQWWRALRDDHTLSDTEHAQKLTEVGFQLQPDASTEKVKVIGAEEHLMVWEEQTATAEE